MRCGRRSPEASLPGMTAQRGFLRSILTLLTGATLAQALPLLAAPALTRLYSPADFGLFALFSGLMSNIAVMAGGRYEMAIVLPEDDDEALHLLALSLLIAFGWMLLLLPLSLVEETTIARVLGHPEVAHWLPVLAVTVFAVGCSQSLGCWANRRRRDGVMASSRFLQSGGTVGTQWLAGWAKFGAGGLILGQLLGTLLAAVWLAVDALRQGGHWLARLRWQQIKAVAWRYREFPTINAMHAFVTAFQETGALWVLSHAGGASALGYYGLTIRVLKAPIGLVGGVVAQVLYQRIATVRHAGQAIAPLVQQMVLMLGGLAVVPVVILLLWGEPLFALLFGAQWDAAGRYAQWLAPYMLLYFVASPLSTLPLVLGRQRTAFAFAVVGILAYLLGLLIGSTVWHNVEWGLGLTSALMTTYFAVFLLWLWRIARHDDRQRGVA